MKQNYLTPPGFTFRLQPFGITTALLLLFFLLNICIGYGQNVTISSGGDQGPIHTRQQTIPLTFEFNEPLKGFVEPDINVNNGSLSDFNVVTPNFGWLESYDVDDFEVTVGDASNIEAKTNRVVVSVATNSIGEVFVLTFGNGIIKYDLDGNKTIFNSGDDLESPLDIAFDSEDYLYVADNGQARQIKVYSPEGVFLPNRTIGNGTAGSSENNFYGPIGLTFDSQDNLYVTDAYNGPSQEEFDRYSVKIYYANGDYLRFIGDNGIEFNNPYRIAVDKNFNIYVSDAGGENGRILVFDANQNLIDILEGTSDNLGSPGSIEIDRDSGLIYIADLGEEISIGQFLLAQQNPEDLLDVFPDIVEGIENDEYNIKVFDESRSFVATISNNVDLPIDLALDSCGKLIVLNAYFDGEIREIFGFPVPDISLDFDIEFYNRLPSSFTANLEINDECIAAEVNINAAVGADAECNVTPTTGDTFSATWDEMAPLIDTCYQEGQTVDLGDEIPNYIEEGFVVFEDNCEENLEYDQTPAPGTVISQTTTNVNITAIDEAGNVSIACTFNLVVEEEEEPLTIMNCNYDTIEFTANENCQYIMDDFTDDFAASNEDAQIVQNPEPGVLVSGEVIVTLTPVLNGEEGEPCSFKVKSDDITSPVISNCPTENPEYTIQEGETYILEDYTEQILASDNCDTDIELVQEPLPGTEIAADQPVTVSAIDSSGNKSECTFTVEITVEDSYSFQCIGDFTVRLGEEAQNSGVMEIPTSDFIISNTSNLQFELEDQQFTCADIGTNPLTINARNTETGDTYSCIVQVTVIDVGAPMIICPAETLTRNLPEEGYEVPNFFENRISDNCNGIDELDLVQVPSAGTIIETPGSYTFNLTATDTYDNVETCEITIILEDNRQTPQYTCIPEPEIPDISLDENCSPQYPDFAGLIETENFTPEFIVTREQLTEETYLINIEIRDTATGELVGDCSFSASVVDLIPPRISCPDDQRESFDPETGFEVPDYENMAGVSDNCGEVSFRQEPEAGEIIYTNTTVNLFVEDENGLEASCSFELELTETDVLNITCQIDKNVSPDDNCSFWLPDYTGTAEVNFDGAQITQTPPVGSIITENTQIQLTASLNGETDDCYFMVNLVDDETPVASCVSGFVVNLDNSGNANITPEELDNSSTDNCGIVSMSLSQTEFNRSDIGEVPVTLTVRDDAGNMDSCETTVEVVEEPSGAFQCRENIALSLDENGKARLDLQDLYTGDATDFSLEASRLNFSCSDLGEVEIQLNYTGEQNGSCIINVEVRDEIPPYIGTDLVELSLDNEGFAYLKQEDVLAEDNCSEELIYRFDRSLFTCKDVGYNMVNVEVEDSNGNIAEKLIELDITGEQCDTPEDNDIKFPILYPNPSDGIFTIATPEGMFIERIRVFDSRGRYIMQQDYSGNARFYRMSILAVAESVYTLQIFTNEGVTVKRVIIKR
jgi:hypothetical protein